MRPNCKNSHATCNYKQNVARKKKIRFFHQQPDVFIKNNNRLWLTIFFAKFQQFDVTTLADRFIKINFTKKQISTQN